VYRSHVADPRKTQTIVLLIGDERSRAVCSVALRSSGYEVLVADGVRDVVALARADGAQLVIADLPFDERTRLHRELAEHLPGVNCLFVHQRYALDEFARFLGEASLARDQSPPRN
jgi:DNA-binding NtrC family response regulator